MTNKFRECYEPHLRDYPDCFEECGCDECEAPLYSEQKESTVQCKNCGAYRTMNDSFIVEKCPNCGDDEYEVWREVK